MHCTYLLLTQSGHSCIASKHSVDNLVARLLYRGLAQPDHSTDAKSELEICNSLRSPIQVLARSASALRAAVARVGSGQFKPIEDAPGSYVKIRGLKHAAAAPIHRKTCLFDWEAPDSVEHQCPLWVISGHSDSFRRCPLYPRKRTLTLLR